MRNFLIAAISLLTFLSCDSSSERNGVLGRGLSSKSYSDLAMVEEVEEAEVSEKVISANPKAEFSKKKIKRGSLLFETEDIASTKSLVVQLVKANNGYISNDNQDDSGGRRIYNYLTIRIPAANFDPFINELSKSVNKFERKDVHIEDVTEKYYDLKTRIKNKKKLEQKFLEILKKAKSVKEILDVEREINKLRTEIESMEGRFRYLNKQVTYSTISVQFYQVNPEDTNFTGEMAASFKNGFTYLKNTFLGLLSIWPFVLIVGFLYWIVKSVRKRRNKA
ncbi:MAG: hypothetical protein CMB99_07950 [Flavobacteriaceae bacterium]|nr:hypothetical protein [Flavobacteriaceae bacterium]|tara:strand:- start:162869 stop:163705 length:837 start_codon:yes stop_codon:yes gene_type:complete